MTGLSPPERFSRCPERRVVRRASMTTSRRAGSQTSERYHGTQHVPTGPQTLARRQLEGVVGQQNMRSVVCCQGSNSPHAFKSGALLSVLVRVFPLELLKILQLPPDSR